MSDLQYRPNHYDDWGMIRNADGSMHATVHRPEIYLGEFDDHREVDTDPFADLARKIIFFDDLEAENVSLRQLLSKAETREREARAKALEEAALWHDAKVQEYTDQIAVNDAYLARGGRLSHESRANEYCDDMRSCHRRAAAAFRALQSEER